MLNQRPVSFWRYRRCSGPGQPGNLNAIPIFQGLPINVRARESVRSIHQSRSHHCHGISAEPATVPSLNFPQSIFLNQNYLNPSTFLPLGFQPFGYPQGKNFVYATPSRPTSASSAIWVTG